jgi:hypothetical protein
MTGPSRHNFNAEDRCTRCGMAWSTFAASVLGDGPTFVCRPAVVHHSCGDPRCTNVDHLEIVNVEDNQ